MKYPILTAEEAASLIKNDYTIGIGGFSSSAFLYYLFKGNINKNEIIQFILIFLYEGYTLEIDNLFLPIISNNLFLLNNMPVIPHMPKHFHHYI